MEALVAFGSALGGAALGAWLGHLSATAAQHRQDRVGRAFDLQVLGEEITIQAIKCMNLRRSGMPLGLDGFELASLEIRFNNRLRVAAIDRPNWRKITTYLQLPLDLLGEVTAWNHVADQNGNSIKSVAARIQSLATLVLSASLGDNESERQLRDQQPIADPAPDNP